MIPKEFVGKTLTCKNCGSPFTVTKKMVLLECPECRAKYSIGDYKDAVKKDTEPKQKMHFSVCGEGITDIARERCYSVMRPGAALKMLLTCMSSAPVDYEERLGIAMQVLDGKAEITGDSDTEEGLYLNPTEDNPSQGLLDFLDSLGKQVEEKNAEYEKAIGKINFIMDFIDLPESTLKIMNMRYAEEHDGEPLFKDFPGISSACTGRSSAMLDDFMEQFCREQKQEKGGLDYDPAEDYGWLSPNGTYYPVPFGEHEKWAGEFMHEKHPMSECPELYHKNKDAGNYLYSAKTDILVYNLHWVLIDAPWQGKPRVTYDESRGLTKKQSEFLYKYFMDRGYAEDADRIMSENMAFEQGVDASLCGQTK